MRFPFFRNRDSVKNGILISIRRTGDGFHPGLFTIMMKFAVAELLKMGMQEEQIWISQERKMCCGFGKCGHCRMNDTYICLDGPVFCYSEGKKLFD